MLLNNYAAIYHDEQKFMERKTKEGYNQTEINSMLNNYLENKYKFELEEYKELRQKKL